jgi:hypothetical protein
MMWKGTVACMRDMRNAYKFCTGLAEVKRHWSRQEDDVRSDLGEMECGDERIHLAHGISIGELFMNTAKSPQNYCFLWTFPSSGILETRKHDVSETGSISVLR